MADSTGSSPPGSLWQILNWFLVTGLGAGVLYFLGNIYQESYYQQMGLAPGEIALSSPTYMLSGVKDVLIPSFSALGTFLLSKAARFLALSLLIVAILFVLAMRYLPATWKEPIRAPIERFVATVQWHRRNRPLPAGPLVIAVLAAAAIVALMWSDQDYRPHEFAVAFAFVGVALGSNLLFLHIRADKRVRADSSSLRRERNRHVASEVVMGFLFLVLFAALSGEAKAIKVVCGDQEHYEIVFEGATGPGTINNTTKLLFVAHHDGIYYARPKGGPGYFIHNVTRLPEDWGLPIRMGTVPNETPSPLQSECKALRANRNFTS